MGQDQSAGICGHANNSSESDIINSSQIQPKIQVHVMKTENNYSNFSKEQRITIKEKQKAPLQQIQQLNNKSQQNKENYLSSNKKQSSQVKEKAKAIITYEQNPTPNNQQSLIQEPSGFLNNDFESNDIQTDFTESQLNEQNVKTSNPRQEIYCQKEKTVSFKHFAMNQYSNSLIKKTAENNKYSFKKQISGQSQIIIEKAKVSEIDQSIEKKNMNIKKNEVNNSVYNDDENKISAQKQQIKTIVDGYQSTEKKSKKSGEKFSGFKRSSKKKPENKFINNSTCENETAIKKTSYFSSNKTSTVNYQKKQDQTSSNQSKILTKQSINSNTQQKQNKTVNQQQASPQVQKEIHIDNYDKKLKEIQQKYEKSHQAQHLQFQSQLDKLNQLSSVSFLKSRQEQIQSQPQNLMKNEYEIRKGVELEPQCDTLNDSQNLQSQSKSQSIVKKQRTQTKQIGGSSSTKNQRSASVKSFKPFKEATKPGQLQKPSLLKKNSQLQLNKVGVYSVNQIVTNKNILQKESPKNIQPDLKTIELYQTKEQETLLSDSNWVSKQTEQLQQLQETADYQAQHKTNFTTIQSQQLQRSQQQQNYFPNTQPNAKSQQKSGSKQFQQQSRKLQEKKIEINRLLKQTNNNKIENEEVNNDATKDDQMKNESIENTNTMQTKEQFLEKRQEFLEKKKKELGFSTGKSSKSNLNQLNFVQLQNANEIKEYQQEEESAQKFNRPIMINNNEIFQSDSEEIIQTDSKALTDLFEDKKKSFFEKQLKKSGQLQITEVKDMNPETKKQQLLKNRIKMKEYGKSLLKNKYECESEQCDYQEIDKQKDVIDRLTNGIKPKINKKEMIENAKRKYKNLPEVQKMQEEKQKSERLKNDFQERQQKVKALEQKLKKIRFGNESTN